MSVRSTRECVEGLAGRRRPGQGAADAAVLERPAAAGEEAEVAGRVLRGGEEHEDDLDGIVGGGVEDAGVGDAEGDLGPGEPGHAGVGEGDAFVEEGAALLLARFEGVEGLGGGDGCERATDRVGEAAEDVPLGDRFVPDEDSRRREQVG
jgi:hypothetical protein